MADLLAKAPLRRSYKN